MLSPTTTITQLIELGLIKDSTVKAWKARLARKTEKSNDDLTQARASLAVAFYLSRTYGTGIDNKFRVKPTEKALLQYGISRRMIEITFRKLVDLGTLANNKDSVTNNCHARHWITQLEA